MKQVHHFPRRLWLLISFTPLLSSCSPYLTCISPVLNPDSGKKAPSLIGELNVYGDYIVVSTDGQVSLIRALDPTQQCRIYRRDPQTEDKQKIRWADAARLLENGYQKPFSQDWTLDSSVQLTPGIYAWSNPTKALASIAAGRTLPNPPLVATPNDPAEFAATSKRVEVNMTMPRYDTSRTDVLEQSKIVGGAASGSGTSCLPVKIEFPSSFPAIQITTSPGLEAVLSQVAKQMSTGGIPGEIPVKVNGETETRIHVDGQVHGMVEAGQKIDILQPVAEDKMSRPGEPLKLLYAEGNFGDSDCVESLRLGFEGDLSQVSGVQLWPVATCQKTMDDEQMVAIAELPQGLPDLAGIDPIPLQLLDSSTLRGDIQGSAAADTPKCYLLSGIQMMTAERSVKREVKVVATDEKKDWEEIQDFTKKKAASGPAPAEGKTVQMASTADPKKNDNRSTKTTIESTWKSEKSEAVKDPLIQQIRVARVCPVDG